MSDPRETIGGALGLRSGGAVQAFGRVVSADDEAVAPCWGDLADHFEAILASDEARIDAFEGLRAAKDLAAFILFLDLNRARPAVLKHVWGVAATLPATVQCALVALDASTPFESDRVAALHPAARRLVSDSAARACDHELYAAHAAALRALRTRLPQVSEPGIPTP